MREHFPNESLRCIAPPPVKRKTSRTPLSARNSITKSESLTVDTMVELCLGLFLQNRIDHFPHRAETAAASCDKSRLLLHGRMRIGRRCGQTNNGHCRQIVYVIADETNFI